MKRGQKNKIIYFYSVGIFTCLITYFVYHAFNGERGILAFFKLSQKLNSLHHEVETLRSERIQLEHNVSLMRADSLDLDLLDEQARKILGYAKPDELVYIVNENSDKE